MRVAVDVMGGDNAPSEIVRGCLDAVEGLTADVSVIMCGNQETIAREVVAAGGKLSERLAIFHCSEVIGMEDQPAGQPV